ncbi:hypothetical protein [Saccharopolyspora shandongensis]|uniref:hypothetical protein n=1 Tax=Saccharopolyspora shandongensis TaxID=418495 RepID=UPI0015A57C86|nr:hypothetical protein [Saccharopolyspora shandongensis]
MDFDTPSTVLPQLCSPPDPAALRGTGRRVRHSTTLNPGNAIGIAVLTAVA